MSDMVRIPSPADRMAMIAACRRFADSPTRMPDPSVAKEPAAMLQSHVIEIDGVFVGAAIRLHNGYRFVAVNVKLDDLDGSIWPTLADIRRLARRFYFAGRLATPQTH
jgi:hypothetical protein